MATFRAEGGADMELGAVDADRFGLAWEGRKAVSEGGGCVGEVGLGSDRWGRSCGVVMWMGGGR